LMPSPENAVKEQAREDERRSEVRAEAKDTASAGLSSNKNKKVDFDTLKSQITAAGLQDETSKTYHQYTKPINQSGAFIPSVNGYLHDEDAQNLSTLFTDTTKNELDTALEEAMQVHEVGRMFDSIALTADCMEDDMANALFGDFDEEEYEEVLDDFCLTANQEELEDEDGGGVDNGGGGFDYEQHVRHLMEKARALENGGAEGGRDLEDDFFGGATPLHGKIEEEDDDDDFDYDQYGEELEEDEDSLDREFNGEDDSPSQPAVKISDEQQRILCEKFEAALLEYDSDDVGDLDEECEEIGGDRPLEGDLQLEAALNEFLTEKKDDVLFEGTTNKHERKKKTGGSGYSALVDGRLVNASELNKNDDNAADPSSALLVNIEESKKQMQKDLADADAVLANPEMDLPPEEVFIDGKSYFSVAPSNPWDCESILSTYSNLDNNPAVIGRRKKKKGKKKNAAIAGSDVIPEDAPVKIQLSEKTGLPVGVFDSPQPEEDDYDGTSYYGESDTYLSINRGEARSKNESKLEKKERKLAIKEERKICRIQKKIMKEAFKEEFQRRGQDVAADAVGGSTVFRF